MSSLFVSGIPRTAAADEVEVLLRRAFPASTDIVLLRTDASAHKGHAYIHLASEADARAAVLSYSGDNAPLSFGESGPALRVRVSDAAQPRLGASCWEGQPLPARYVAHLYNHCAFLDHEGDHTALLAEVGASVLDAHSPGPAPPVAVFASMAARDQAVVRHPGHLARCGAPHLADLLTAPDASGASAATPTPGTKRPREARAPSSSHAHWRAAGLVPLSPAAALSIVNDYFQQHGHVAFADETGSIALLRLPSYTAGFL